ncbi:Protein FAM164A [Myotis brandtii]|uniref:Protein FAM164A n=1 Tax=Myotis brandtii TaxID=109478 RepID=S7Q940_MYOBR|nr:Protein FAM164A [Myotis brandtii]
MARSTWGRRQRRVRVVAAALIAPQEQREVEKPSGVIRAGSCRLHLLMVYKPPALKKSNSPGTLSSGSSRLPQPSGTSKTVIGVSSGRMPSVSSSLGNKLQTLSPSHKGIAAPHVGANIKPRNSTPPSLARNPASGVLTSKRKTYGENYIARDRDSQMLQSSWRLHPLVPNPTLDLWINCRVFSLKIS